jgi:hypothetical protein
VPVAVDGPARGELSSSRTPSSSGSAGAAFELDDVVDGETARQRCLREMVEPSFASGQVRLVALSLMATMRGRRRVVIAEDDANGGSPLCIMCKTSYAVQASEDGRAHVYSQTCRCCAPPEIARYFGGPAGASPITMDRWQQGECGTYAQALITARPELHLGVAGYKEPDGWAPQHYFVHDDSWAYDSLGAHPLPYRGIHGQFTHVELDHDLTRWGDLAYDEHGSDQEAFDALVDALGQAINLGQA